MKSYLLIFLFFMSNLGFSQSLPDEIDVELYSGGDYQSEKNKGIRSNKVRLNFQYLPNKKLFVCERIYKENKIKVFKKDDSLAMKNINPDSTITIFTNISISAKQVEELLFWLDKDHYEEIILEEEIEWFGDSTIVYQDTCLFPENLKITDFGIDTLTFKNECVLYNLIENKNYDCEQINFDTLFSKILNTYLFEYTISSHSQFYSFSFFYDKKEIKIFQLYPGGLNIRWRIEENGKPKLTILNPFFNECLADFLLSSDEQNLLNFKEQDIFYLLPEF